MENNLGCQECGEFNDTVKMRICGAFIELYGEVKYEVVCDNCEIKHCLNV